MFGVNIYAIAKIVVKTFKAFKVMQLILSAPVTISLHRTSIYSRCVTVLASSWHNLLQKLVLFVEAQSDHKFYDVIMQKNRPPSHAARTRQHKTQTRNKFPTEAAFHDEQSRTAGTCWPGSHKDQVLCAKHLELSISRTVSSTVQIKKKFFFHFRVFLESKCFVGGVSQLRHFTNFDESRNFLLKF